MNDDRNPLAGHPIVSRQEWLTARVALLAKEKDLTKRRDDLARERRALPWVRVDKAYTFDGPAGKQTLPQLFGARTQLVVYHFMFAPDWEAGCKHCSFWADNFDRNVVHLAHRDVRMVAVSRAPLANIEPFRQRMGWTFPWFSSSGSDFNHDFGVAFTPDEVRSGTAIYNYTKPETMADREGVSVFYKDGRGGVFHTYSAYARGIDVLNAAYSYLDLVPKGRDEDHLEFVQSWVRHHDRYED